MPANLDHLPIFVSDLILRLSSLISSCLGARGSLLYIYEFAYLDCFLASLLRMALESRLHLPKMRNLFIFCYLRSWNSYCFRPRYNVRHLPIIRSDCILFSLCNSFRASLYSLPVVASDCCLVFLNSLYSRVLSPFMSVFQRPIVCSFALLPYCYSSFRASFAHLAHTYNFLPLRSLNISYS
jgi:hypothetical protein